MPLDENTIEEQRMMELEQARADGEGSAQKKNKGESETKHFLESGEFILLLSFFGFVEVLQWLLDFVPYLGWIINIIIAFFVGLAYFVWVSGKVAKGAPKKWYKSVYGGAVGGIIPIIPGYLGAIIWLYIEDRKLLKKVGGKIGEMAEKTLEKVK